jgi:hypothetical protein
MVNNLIESQNNPLMKYYIQNKDAGFMGNAIVFHAQNSNGYTAKLEKAHQYTYDEAKGICQGDPGKNKAWPVDYIDNNVGTARHTDSQYLSNENIVDFDKEEESSSKSESDSENADGITKYSEPTKIIASRCPESKIDELKEIVKAQLLKWSTEGSA